MDLDWLPNHILCLINDYYFCIKYVMLPWKNGWKTLEMNKIIELKIKNLCVYDAELYF